MLPLERNKMLNDVYNRVPEWAPVDRTIMVGLRGSDAHGTKLDEHETFIDDVDVFTIVVQPIDFYLGLDNNGKKRQHWDSAGEDLDILVYDIRKFMGLAEQANPNVLNWLWNRPTDYLFMNNLGMLLIDNRDLFLTKKIFPRLIGYSYSQMERMNADKKYEGYMGEKRKMLVNDYGYDVKNAAHSVRLLLMAIEIAETGEMSTYRPEADRNLIKNIKRGNLTLDEVSSMIEHYADVAKKAQDKSDLPESVDREAVNELLCTIIYAGQV